MFVKIQVIKLNLSSAGNGTLFLDSAVSLVKLLQTVFLFKEAVSRLWGGGKKGYTDKPMNAGKLTVSGQFSLRHISILGQFFIPSFYLSGQFPSQWSGWYK